MSRKNIDLSDENERLHIYDRWMKLIRLLTPDSVTSVEEMSDKLGVSSATVRRDLNELHNHGRLKRVRGGAISIDADDIRMPSPANLKGQAGYDLSASENVEAKKKIGRRAANLIEPGEAIIIDGGSTTSHLAQAISVENLAVLTTSVPILFALLQRPQISVLITGGEVFREQNIFLNPYPDGIAANFYATKVFLGAQAITRAGLMQTDPLLVQNEKNLIGRAERVIVLADSSKFGARASLSVCSLAQISTVVTDEGLTAASRKMLEDEGVEVIIA
jgi:DeoR family ulaG and ulaABCDEF operon transcriptional repressor